MAETDRVPEEHRCLCGRDLRQTDRGGCCPVAGIDYETWVNTHCYHCGQPMIPIDPSDPSTWDPEPFTYAEVEEMDRKAREAFDHRTGPIVCAGGCGRTTDDRDRWDPCVVTRRSYCDECWPNRSMEAMGELEAKQANALISLERHEDHGYFQDRDVDLDKVRDGIVAAISLDEVERIYEGALDAEAVGVGD